MSGDGPHGGDRGLEEACGRSWDVAVIGAGPAGTMAARELALSGLDVVLLDRSRFPRSKVCGGCLNASGLATLSAAGLGQLPFRLGGRRISRMRLLAHGRRAVLPAAGAAVSREALDLAMAQRAVAAGAVFLPAVTASVERLDTPFHCLSLVRDGVRRTLAARVVVAATGLAGRFGAPGFETTVAPGSRVGGGTLLDAAPEEVEEGTVVMAWAPRGYVGLVRVEGDRLNAAVAVDPLFAREAGGLGPAARAILLAAGARVPEGLAGAVWHGTPPLTRRTAPVAVERLFLAGDATGYEEPFTGEGMAWALAAGRLVAGFVRRAAASGGEGLAAAWAQTLETSVRRRQRLCRMVAASLRRPLLARTAVAMLARAPRLAGPLVRSVNAPIVEAASAHGAAGHGV